jgi:CheY-like chemotaxis protein
MKKMIGRLIGEDIELVFNPGKDIWAIKVDHSQVDQVTVNLAVNAADAMPDGGKLTIETANKTLDEAFCSNHIDSVPGQYVLITVSDTGTGIEPEILSHIFEPFFTTKELGKGTGLGLSTVYGIIKQSHGFIYVHSEPGVGTRFKLYIPRWVGERQPPGTTTEKKTANVCSKILLVEDDDMVRQLTEDVLRNIGCTVLSVSSPTQALEYCKGRNLDFHLLITDVVMPKMSGKELRDAIEVFKPGVKTLYISGYPANGNIRQDLLNDRASFLPKPFTVNQLVEKVQEALTD